jgi:hypothetical protein
MFRGKNRLSQLLYLLSFEHHVRKVLKEFSVQPHLPQATLAFVLWQGFVLFLTIEILIENDTCSTFLDHIYYYYHWIF